MLTLDADTYLPPNAAAKLIGAAAHPLNRDHGVLAPRAQSLYFHGQSLFSRLFSAGGGVDSYVTAVSETYQDLFGEGIFGGKGIYNLRAFEQATEHLPQNAILSHDCLEGLAPRRPWSAMCACTSASPRPCAPGRPGNIAGCAAIGSCCPSSFSGAFAVWTVSSCWTTCVAP